MNVDQSDNWPSHRLLIREAHGIARLFARMRRRNPTPWRRDGSWWALPSGHRARMKDHVIQIDAGERIGLSIHASHLPEGVKPGNLPDAIDALFAALSPSLNSTRLVEHEDFEIRGVLNIAKPHEPDDSMLDSVAERVGLLIATAARARVRDADWRVHVRHPLPGGRPSVEIRFEGGIGEVDLETTDVCGALVAALPVAHGYALDGSCNWQAAAQRLRHGQPRFGWVSITSRTHIAEPVPDDDPIGIMRALATSAELLAEVGPNLGLDDLLSEIDLTDDEQDSRQTPVEWDPTVFAGDGDPLRDMIDLPEPMRRPLVHSISSAVDSSQGRTATYRYGRKAGIGTRWFPEHPLAHSWDAALTTRDARSLIEMGVLAIMDDDRLIVTRAAEEAVLTSRANASEFGAGPMLPGTVVIGSIGIGLTPGWLRFLGTEPSFHAEAEVGESARLAHTRMVCPGTRQIIVRSVAMCTRSSPNPVAWLHPWSPDSNFTSDELMERLPEHWAVMLDAGWEISNRTREAIGILEAAIAENADLDLSPYVR